MARRIIGVRIFFISEVLGAAKIGFLVNSEQWTVISDQGYGYRQLRFRKLSSCSFREVCCWTEEIPPVSIVTGGMVRRAWGSKGEKEGRHRCVLGAWHFFFRRPSFPPLSSGSAHHSAANAVSERKLLRKVTRTRQRLWPKGVCETWRIIFPICFFVLLRFSFSVTEITWWILNFYNLNIMKKKIVNPFICQGYESPNTSAASLK